MSLWFFFIGACVWDTLSTNKTGFGASLCVFMKIWESWSSLRHLEVSLSVSMNARASLGIFWAFLSVSFVGACVWDTLSTNKIGFGASFCISVNTWASLRRLGASLRCLRAFLCRLGRLWGVFEHLWASLGRLWSVTWGVLGVFLRLFYQGMCMGYTFYQKYRIWRIFVYLYRN